ncbi:asparagine synthase-related protein [Streptomyces virginiae]|uniref:asparagine synthase-related protein n=1 Tax=Streptomyces TaxID=1883 RepID=UPI002E2C1FFB|nr:asparagine synthase-related protein [Streptomyces sp. NBC_00239]WSX96991.1 asparagine synthase-related protein [Streptomyces goshikiensis]
MLETHLPVRNVYWNPDGGTHPERISAQSAPALVGRFAHVQQDGDRVTAIRDQLGLNKLYVGFHPDRGVIAANYLADLVTAGIAFTGTYAIPAGSIVTLDPDRRTGVVRSFASLPARAGSNDTPAKIAHRVSELLDQGMRHLADAHPGLPVAVCLSGGADSSVVAAYTREHFPHAVAYTYSFGDEHLSQDAAAAQRVAAHLNMPLRLVRADRETLLTALPPALLHGQDWRDFNVHAAVVNEVLGAAIADDHPHGALVFTGDLMNEFLADYTPVPYAGSLYYRLPNLPPDRLRVHLTRGVQTGDREVGVFAAHGLTVVQPYSWATTELLALPEPVSKPGLMTRLARHRLPDSTLRRPKVRAQIGDLGSDTGVLPQLLQAGITQPRLEGRFRHDLGISSSADLHRTIRGGIHQPVPHVP